MKNLKRYSTDADKQKKIIKIIKNIIQEEENISFAYLHGSFVDHNNNFGDVDIAIFIEGTAHGELLDYEFALERKLNKEIPYPVEVRVLNKAPLSFRYSVIKKGIRLLERDPDRRGDFQRKSGTVLDLREINRGRASRGLYQDCSSSIAVLLFFPIAYSSSSNFFYLSGFFFQTVRVSFQVFFFFLLAVEKALDGDQQNK